MLGWYSTPYGTMYSTYYTVRTSHFYLLWYWHYFFLFFHRLCGISFRLCGICSFAFVASALVAHRLCGISRLCGASLFFLGSRFSSCTSALEYVVLRVPTQREWARHRRPHCALRQHNTWCRVRSLVAVHVSAILVRPRGRLSSVPACTVVIRRARELRYTLVVSPARQLARPPRYALQNISTRRQPLVQAYIWFFGIVFDILPYFIIYSDSSEDPLPAHSEVLYKTHWTRFFRRSGLLSVNRRDPRISVFCE